MGKTNLHELSLGWTSNNATFGAVQYQGDRKNVSIRLEGVQAVMTGGHADVLVTDSAGNVVRDSRAERISHDSQLLDSLAPKLARMATLRSLFESYSRAVGDAKDELVSRGEWLWAGGYAELVRARPISAWPRRRGVRGVRPGALIEPSERDSHAALARLPSRFHRCHPSHGRSLRRPARRAAVARPLPRASHVRPRVTLPRLLS